MYYLEAEEIDPRSQEILELANDLCEQRGLELHTLTDGNRRFVLNAARQLVDDRIETARKQRVIEMTNQVEAGYQRFQQQLAEIRLSAGIPEDTTRLPLPLDEFVQSVRTTLAI